MLSTSRDCNAGRLKMSSVSPLVPKIPTLDEDKKDNGDVGLWDWGSRGDKKGAGK